MSTDKAFNDATNWLGGASANGTCFERTAGPSNKAPWLVFIHGVALGARVWRPWQRALMDRFRLLAIDVPGYGDSALQGRVEDRTIETWAQWIIEVIDFVGIDSAVFVGESLGGTTVLKLASSAPSRVDAAVVCSTGFKGALIDGVGEWPSIVAEGGSAGWSQYMNGQRFRAADAGEVWELCEVYQRASNPDVFVHDGLMLRGSDLSSTVASIECPVLMLQPGSSPFISRAHAFELEDAIPQSELVLFGPSRHGLAFAYAAEAAILTRSFLDRQLGFTLNSGYGNVSA